MASDFLGQGVNDFADLFESFVAIEIVVFENGINLSFVFSRKIFEPRRVRTGKSSLVNGKSLDVFLGSLLFLFEGLGFVGEDLVELILSFLGESSKMGRKRELQESFGRERVHELVDLFLSLLTAKIFVGMDGAQLFPDIGREVFLEIWGWAHREVLSSRTEGA